jgi:hypothetical protein
LDCTARGEKSLQASLPAAIVTLGLPSNRSSACAPPSTFGPLMLRATLAASMVNGSLPNWFEKRTRTASPPALTRMIWRRV